MNQKTLQKILNRLEELEHKVIKLEERLSKIEPSPLERLLKEKDDKRFVRVEDLPSKKFTASVPLEGTVKSIYEVAKEVPNKLTSSQINMIKTLLEKGRKLEAIKVYREIMGVGLFEARKAVEDIDVY